MRFMIPLPLSITDSNIAESEGTNGTIYPFDVVLGYNATVQRYYNSRLYEAYTDIHPLANFLWDNIDPQDTNATNLHTQTIIDKTAVVIVIGDIVYWNITKSYYESKQNRTVDFTTEVDDPANWTNLGTDADYRWEYLYPVESSIYWKDLGATNRHKCTDKSINTYSSKTGTEMWFEFEAINIDKVVLFNLFATDARIIAYTDDINNPFYDNTKTNILDTTSIVNWRTYSRFVASVIKNIDWSIPFYSGTATFRVILSGSGLLQLGEILIGQKQEIGITLDGIPVSVQSAGQIIETANGDIIFEDEGDKTKVYEIYNFNMIYDSITIDSVVDKCSEVINRRIVVSGEDTDDPTYRSLVVYGFARDASPNLILNNEKSKIKLQVQRFI